MCDFRFQIDREKIAEIWCFEFIIQKQRDCYQYHIYEITVGGLTEPIFGHEVFITTLHRLEIAVCRNEITCNERE